MNETFKFSFEADLGDLNSALSRGADTVSVFERKISQLEDELKRLDNASAAAEKELEQLNREFKKGAIEERRFNEETERLEAEIKRLGNTTARTQAKINRYQGSLRRLSPAYQAQTINAGKALPVLQEFSRIIEDAPFGIIGVGNNITQLGQSFSVLSRRAGGARAALGIVAGAISGPGGLLVLLSAVITTLTLFSGRFRRGGNEGAKAIDKIKKKIEELLGPLNQLQRIENLRKDITELRGESTLKELRNVENILKRKLQILNTELETEKAKLRQQRLDATTLSNLEALGAAVKEIAVGALAAGLFLGDLTFKGLLDSPELQAIKKFGEFLDDAITIEDQTEATKKQLSDIEQQEAVIREIQTEILKNLRELGKVGNEVNKILASGFGEIGAGLFVESLSAVSEFTGALANNILSFSGLARREAFELADALTTVGKQAITVGKGVDQSLRGGLGSLVLFLAEATKEIRELSRIYTETANNIQNLLRDGFGPALAEFGETLGQALARGASFVQAAGAGLVGALTTLLSAIADELIKLGTAAVAIGTVQESLEKLTPGAGKIVVGLAAIAVGTALKGISAAARGSVSGANGGQSFSVPGGGGGGSFGGSSSVSANAALTGRVEFEIAGTKLVGVLNRTLKGKGKTVSDIIG